MFIRRVKAVSARLWQASFIACSLLLTPVTSHAVEAPRITVERNTNNQCVLTWLMNDSIVMGWNVYADDAYTTTVNNITAPGEFVTLDVDRALSYYLVAFDGNSMFSPRSNTLSASDFELCELAQPQEPFPVETECPADPVVDSPINVNLRPPEAGVTLYWKMTYSFGKQEQIFVAVLGWETIDGADGYDIYRNGEFYATSGGPSDNGGFPIIEVRSELPVITFPGCPRCVDTGGYLTIGQVNWQVVAWDRNGNYSSRSRIADQDNSPEHPGVVRLQTLIDY